MVEVAFLHPGLMGETLAANCSQAALWASHGRSQETCERATQHGLIDVVDIAGVCDRADIVVSICPPAAALALAHDVADQGFAGLYVDANAVAPETARTMAERFEYFVDGSVIGPPAHQSGTTRLYLSGDRASEVADLYTDSVLDARVIDGDVGAASALKMAYASWTKIGAALQLAIRALADAEGVSDALVDEWNLSQPGMVERSERVAAGVSPKAWRFTGEMEQIAHAFGATGLPAGFAEGASDVYERLTGFKGRSASLDEVIDTLAGSPDERLRE